MKHRAWPKRHLCLEAGSPEAFSVSLSDMREAPIRALAVFVIPLAAGTLILAMVLGGDILMIAFGLALAAMSMELFRLAQPKHDDED